MTKVVVLMGVSGSGKSTVGEILAQLTGGKYVDGDDFHPAENVEKMRNGVPLSDEDRSAWFDALSILITEQAAANQWTFIACSALRRKYRDRLRHASPKVGFVMLEGSFELINRRMQSRENHYMPASLLESQFEALETPTEAEQIPIVSIDQCPEAIAKEIAGRLNLSIPESLC